MNLFAGSYLFLICAVGIGSCVEISVGRNSITGFSSTQSHDNIEKQLKAVEIYRIEGMELDSELEVIVERTNEISPSVAVCKLSVLNKTYFGFHPLINGKSPCPEYQQLSKLKSTDITQAIGKKSMDMNQKYLIQRFERGDTLQRYCGVISETGLRSANCSDPNIKLLGEWCMEKIYVRPVAHSTQNAESTRNADTITKTSQAWTDEDNLAKGGSGQMNIMLFTTVMLPVVAAPIFIFMLVLLIRRVTHHHYEETECRDVTNEHIYACAYPYENMSRSRV